MRLRDVFKKRESTESNIVDVTGRPGPAVRPPMKRLIIFCLVSSFCLLAILFAASRNNWWSSITKAEAKVTKLQMPGIRGNVTIRRDGRGIPFIEAENEEDLYFAQGYAAATDRLWQMELLRRTGRGELAEIFGSSVLNEDKQRRNLGFAVVSEQMVSRLSSSSRAVLEAYARGVNALIESLSEKSLPLEFRLLQFRPRPWRPADSLVIGKVFTESLTTTWQRDLMREELAGLPRERKDALMPRVSPLDVVMVGSDNVQQRPLALSSPVNLPRRRATEVEADGSLSQISNELRRSLERVGIYAEEIAASNNWVVSGKRTVTGKPLLANDPHLSPSAPSIWYMAHLSAPTLRVAGVTVAGVPGIIIGHNDRIAWGITNVEADVQDLYIEKFDKADPLRYLTPAGWREAEVRREEIKVRKNLDDPATETVEYNVTVTRHGPIIYERGGIRYALAWPAVDQVSIELEAYYALNRAGNWQEFRDALSRYTGFPLNYVYADVEGHIGYWAAGRYPIRKTGEGTLPYDGATDAGDWTGYVPFEDTPHVYDPPSGIIVTANNRIVGQDYPHYITHDWAAPYRARRIYDLLSAKAKLSIDDFRAIQADTYSMPDAIFTAEAVKLGRPLAANSPEWREIVAAFDGWDAMMSSDSRVMPLSKLMRDAFQRRVLIGTLGEGTTRRYAWANSGTFFDRIITTRPREWLPKEYDSYETLLVACYKDAQESLTKRLGAERSDWTWGRLVQVRFRHPLANAPLDGEEFVIPPIPQNGGASTVNRAGHVSMRYIADLSNWDNTQQGLPLGQSGDPGSPHWKDQLADWQAVTPRAFVFSKKAVTGAAKETLLLVPKAAK